MDMLQKIQNEEKEEGARAQDMEKLGAVLYQTMQLVICLEQIHALARVARQAHGDWPVPVRGLCTVDGNEAVGRVDGFPEGIVPRVVMAAVNGPPVPTNMGHWKDADLRCGGQRKMLTCFGGGGRLADSRTSEEEDLGMRLGRW